MNNLIRGKYAVLAVLLAVVVLLLAVSLLGRSRTGRESDQVKVGFIITGSLDEGGWNSMNYEGVRAACEETGMKLIVKENVEEYTGKCPEAIRELVESGAEVIFLSSFHYAEECRELIEKYSDVHFFASSTSNIRLNNLSAYFPRMYQARYLSGIVAGAMTRTNVIGYVAAMDNSEVNRGINAFALGVQTVNPQAEVVVVRTDSWNNEGAECKAVEILTEKAGADVLSYHQNLPYVVEEADRRGIWSIAYHEDGTKYSDKCLTSVVCDWKQLYRELEKDYATGKTRSEDMLWLGIDRQVVGLSAYGQDVPEEVREMVESARSRLVAGRDVFSGEIRDNQGMVRCREGEMLSDKYLKDEMTWLIEGVRVYED